MSARWRRIRRGEPPCRLCGSEERCKRSPDGERDYCFRSGEVSDPLTPVAPRPKREKVAPAPLSDEALDRCYRVMLALAVELFDVVDFADRMRGRGFKRIPPWFAPLGVERESRALMVKALRRGFGVDVMRVPFARDVNDPKRLPAGILVPVQNADGQVVGVQLRCNEPKAKRRYLWGRGATARVHVAYPDEAPRAERGEVVPPFADRDLETRPVYVTEGALKASVAAQHLRTCVLGLPGVSTNHDECARILAELKAREVVLAFDQDSQENPQVASAVASLAERLQGEGVRVFLEEWESKE